MTARSINLRPGKRGGTGAEVVSIANRVVRVFDFDDSGVLSTSMLANSHISKDVRSFLQLTDPLSNGKLYIRYRFQKYDTGDCTGNLGVYTTPIEILDPQITYSTAPSPASGSVFQISAPTSEELDFESYLELTITSPIYGFSLHLTGFEHGQMNVPLNTGVTTKPLIWLPD